MGCYQKLRRHRPLKPIGRTPDFGTHQWPYSTKCSDANFYFLLEAVATVLPAVPPFDFFTIDMISYGVCEL